MKNTLKNALKTSVLLTLPFAVNGAILVNDTFDVGTPPTTDNDVADTLDIGWTGVFNSNGVSVTSGALLSDGNYLLNDATTGFSMIRGALPVDSRLTMGIGDTVSLSFDFRYTGAVSNASTTGLRFGLFDSTGLGTVVQAGTGTGNTGLLLVRDTSASVNQDMGSGANAAVAFDGVGDSVLTGTMDSGIDSAAISAFLSITRLDATTLTITAIVNGGTATVTDVDNVGDTADFLSNFSGGYIVIRNGAPTTDFVIDNVVVVPEPSTVGLIFGGIFLGVAIIRRRIRS